MRTRQRVEFALPRAKRGLLAAVVERERLRLIDATSCPQSVSTSTSPAGDESMTCQRPASSSAM
jgi:hypothetical protein